MTIEFLQSTTVRLTLGLAILMIMSVVGFYVVRRFRDGAEETETTSDMLSKFREMRHSGELQDEEYRSIKTILAARMQAESKQDGESS